MGELPRWQRRSFLKAGAAGAAAMSVSCTLGESGPRTRSTDPELHTALCDLLGIRHPILQSGMGGVAGHELAAAVSNAGGLGILAAGHLPPDEVRHRIQEVRRLTDRPFGVNLLLHPEVWPPVDASVLPDGLVRGVQTALNRFRERMGLPPSFARPERRPDYVPGAIEVILEERVPVFSIGLGDPPGELVNRFHSQGAKVIAMAATVDDARQLAASGVDAIVAQGHEAGGHRSTWVKGPTAEHAHIGTMTLVPQVVDAVNVPVIAAGGISNGRGIIASLGLGAGGVMLGTRFVATREAIALDPYKNALVERDSDATTVTDSFSGLYARVIRNTFTVEYAASGAPVLPGYLQSSTAADIFQAAASNGDLEYLPMWAGQGIGMIHDLPAAGEVVEGLVREARAAAASFADSVGLG